MAEILPTTLPETTASSLLNEAITPASWNLANPGKIFQTLRDAITDPAWDPYVVLGAIAEAAHALSEANAAALAMRRDGAVVCVGRSGDTAPELGARLSVDSGISGECLRTGKTLRCDNTQKDYRVDPVVCLRLGLASIAAVPLHHDQRVIGILETFSTRPYAFAEEHMQALQNLAKLAELAYIRTAAVQASSEVDAGKKSVIANVAARSRTGALRVAALLSARKWLYVAGAAAAILAVGLGLPLLRRSSTGGTESAQANGSRPATPATENLSSASSGATLTWSATSERPPSSKPSPSYGIQQASRVDKEFGSTTDPPPSATIRPTTPEPDNPELITPEKEPPPLIASSDHSPLRAVLAGAPAVPRFTTPVSEGVTDGTLTRKVMPIYPPQALPLRLSGPVVLEGTITEDGKLTAVSVVSGNPTLAQAAIDAVRQWRYKPYLLNRKPVPMKTQITIDFKGP